MALYKLQSDHSLEEIKATAFSSNQILEQDLQKLILHKPEILGEDLLIFSEEYCEWNESRKRIDLLALDRAGNLVVIEIKRDHGFHMDLQAIRYAAMLSQMSYEDAVATYQAFLQKTALERDTRDEINKFITGFNEEITEFAKDIRIILVSNEFSKEITAVSLWLRSKNIDIKCVKLEHYYDKNTSSTYIDSDVIIPLKEAEDYLISTQKKEDTQQDFIRSVNSQKDYTKYEFKGQEYGKGRLVLEVMKDYIQQHPHLSLIELQQLFPSSLQSSLDVIVDLDSATEINNKGYKRYFNQEDDLIHLGSGEIGLVCSQWGIGNIDNFIDKVHDLYKSEVITIRNKSKSGLNLTKG